MKQQHTGLYLPDGGFVRFSETSKPAVGSQVATRSTALGMTNFFGLLPNPDPVLRKLGKSVQVYRDLRSDGHVGGCIRRRKAAVKRMERGLTDNANTRAGKNIAAVLADLDLERIISEILDAALYGYQPLEVIWGYVGGMFVPVDVIGKPAEWFRFDDDNQLRFLAKGAGAMGVAIPPNTMLLPRQDPSYDNPYGQADLSRCFWPTKFKQGGMDFWFKFIEKYGMPWLVGKNPPGTPDHETEALLDNLEAMIQDAVAVIPNDSSIEILEAGGKGASGAVFEGFVLHMRSEVSIALLGQNQTTEADATNASAQAGLEVADEIADADAGMVAATVNDLIGWIHNFNFAGPAPKYDLWRQESVSKELAERDEKLNKAGAKFTNQYFQRAYGLQPGDLAEGDGTDAAGPVNFAEGEEFPDQVAIDAALNALPGAELDEDMRKLIMPLFDRIAEQASPDELLGKLADIYPALDESALQERLARALFVAKIWGRLNA